MSGFYARRRFASKLAGIVASAAIGSLALTSGAAARPLDGLTARAAALPVCTVFGTGAEDLLRGTPGNDVICAVAGNDRILGGRGDDVIFGSTGDDDLDGGPGNDRLFGFTGRDELHGGRGDDVLQGSGEADVLSGGSGADTVDYADRRGGMRVTIGRRANDGFPGEGDDVRGDVESVLGGHGDDVLIGNRRANRLRGGDGNDVLHGGRGNDRLFGGAGADSLRGRDGSAFTDRLNCGAGPDVAFVDGRDRVARNCETRPAPPPGQGRNHAPTSVSLSGDHVAENSPAGTTVGTLTATDSDRGQHVAFQLVAGSGAADNGSFAITGSTLRMLGVSNYESKHSYSVRVRATDDGHPPRSVERVLTVAITDVNEPPSALALSSSGVTENQPVGTPVGTLTATDPDAGDHQTYTLVSGPGDGGNGSFAIDGSTLRTAAILDYETTKSYSIRLRATDDGTPAGSVERTFTVTVADTGEPPNAADRTATMGEDGFTTITLSAADPEGDDPLSFDAGDPDHGSLGSIGPVTCDHAVPNVCTADVTYTPDLDFNGVESFAYTASDGTHESTPASIAVTVDPLNDAPVATPASMTTDEDTPLALDLGSLASDVETVDGDLVYDIVTQPTHGTATGTTYTPDADYNGPDSLTYKVTDRGDPDSCTSAPCDPAKSSTTETVSLTVDPVNDAPVATPASRTTDEETPVALNLDALVSDVETADADLTYEIVTPPAHGLATATTYTPDADYNGADSLTYKVTDRGDPDNCTSVPCAVAKSDTGIVSITVDPVNDSPAAAAGSRTTDEDTPLTLNLDALVSDVETADGDLLYEIVTPPAHGIATETTYTPDADFNGTDSVEYKVTDRGDPDNCSSGPCDAAKTSATETVSITVDPVNDAPLAPDADRTTAEDTPVALNLDALVSDRETSNANLTYEIVTPPAHGAADTTTYTPDADYNGPDSLTYKVTDRGDPDGCSAAPCAAAKSATGTIMITVDAVNDPPVNTVPAGPITAVEETDTPITGVSVADSDALGQPVQVVLSADHGDITVNPSVFAGVGPLEVAGNGTSSVTVTAPLSKVNATFADASGMVYHGDAAYTGGDALTVTTNDLGNTGSGGAKTDTDAIALSVVPPNAAPVAADTNVTTAEDTAKTITLSASDDDGDDPLAFAKGTAPAHGSLGPIGPVSCDHGAPNVCTAIVTYTPEANFNGPDSFTFTVNDGQVDSAAATVTLDVTAVNDVPKLENIEGPALAYTENDPATGITTATTVSDVDSANFDTGTLTVDYATGGTPDDRLEILNQGQIAVSGTNVTHDGTTIGSFTGGGGSTPLVVTLNANATPSATEALVRAIGYRNVSDNPATAARTVRFVLTDGDGGTSASATRSIALTAVDDPPTLTGIEPGALAYTENDPAAAISSSLTVTDPDSSITGATVAIDAGLASGEDVLGFTNQLGITGSYSAATGVLTLTGSASPADYQTALRAVTYRNTSDDPAAQTRTIVFTVNGAPAAASRDVTVTAVNDAPVADDESFGGTDGGVGNTSLVGNDPTDGAPALSSPKKGITGDILAGDTDAEGDTLVVVAEAKATNDGGSVTIEADGDFIFTPKASTSCTDHSDFFDYTVSDQNATGPGPTPGTDTGRVTIGIAGCVWYVNNNGPAGNSGTSDAPFDTLAQAETASTANDTVFVFDGDNTSTGYGGDGYAMNAGERLIGEHEGLVVTGNTLHPANPGARPTLTATNADVISLDSGNEVRGFDIDPSGTGGGIAGGAGDNGGTIDAVNINDSAALGTQAGLELNGASGAFNVTNLTVNNSATGVLLNNAGTVDFGSTTITSAGARGLDATGTNMGSSTFDAISAAGVRMLNTGGTTVFGDGSGVDLNLTTSTGAAFDLNNAGSITVGSAGIDNVSANGGPAIDVRATPGAALAFDDVDSANSVGDGIDLAGLGTGPGAGTFSATSGDISGAGGIAFDLDGGSGDVSYPGAIGNGTGQSAEITNRSGGAVTLSGAIADSGDAGGGISLSGNTGGSTTFSGTSKVLNTTISDAVSFTGSDGHTLNLTSGGLDVDTTIGQGIAATNSGSLRVTGSANTINTTTGTALNVTNTDIGSVATDDLEFRSITATDPTTSGIVLNNTASPAGLIVTGNSAGVCGGDVNTATSPATQTAPVTADCTGGTISSAGNAGIDLTSVPGGVSLTRMRVNAGADDGIRATNVGTTGAPGIDLVRTLVQSNGGAVGHRGLDFINVRGTSSINTSTISGSAEDNARWENDTGTLALTVTNATFADNSATSGADGLLLRGNANVTTMTALITGSLFLHNRDDGFQVAVGTPPASPNMNVTFTGNDVVQGVNNVPNNAALSMSPGDASHMRLKLDNNDFSGSLGSGLILNPGPNSTSAATTDVIVTNNRIGTAAAGSGSENGIGLWGRSAGNGANKFEIRNNTIQHFQQQGMYLYGNEGTGQHTDYTVTGNTIQNPDDNVHFRMLLEAGATSGDSTDVCFDVGGATAALKNVIPSGASPADIGVARDFAANTLTLRDYAGGDLSAYFNARNTGSPGALTAILSNLSPAGSAAACDLPATPPTP